MFGYVKPDKENLLVKELALYKALYCGLCETIKKKVSFLLPFCLSYDFVFLTMMRATLLKEKGEIKKGRCKYNPLKKVLYSIPNESALFSARCALVLTALNIKDDLTDCDTPFLKKVILAPFYLYLTAKVKRLLSNAPEYKSYIEKVEGSLFKLNSLEKGRCSEIDRFCEAFGDIMADTLSFGLEGNELILAKEIGASVGRYIYLIDAIDDAERDEKKHSFNPLLEVYGSAKAVKESARSLDVALSLHARDALLSFNLTENGEYSSIITNVLSLGLGKESYRIITKNGEKND